MKHRVFRWLQELFERRTNSVLVSYQNKSRDFAFIKRVKSDVDFLLSNNEAYQLLMLARATRKVTGDIAEVGCYQGGSTKLIASQCKGRRIFVFDTFEGLPATSSLDGTFYEGQFKNDGSSLEAVREYLKNEDVELLKGFFPESAEGVKDRTFSFVHLDVDIYQSTKDSLEFFYSRMSKGAVLVSHDYPHEGVRRAFDDFFAGKPEPLIEMSGSQVLFIKL